ncbi:hypothetical protein D3C80_1699250 [compost metagenome]
MQGHAESLLSSNVTCRAWNLGGNPGACFSSRDRRFSLHDSKGRQSNASQSAVRYPVAEMVNLLEEADKPLVAAKLEGEWFLRYRRQA